MNKAQLIEVIAQELNIPKKYSGEMVNAVFDKITETLCNGESVKLSGFGNFIVKEKEERVARNPMTKEEITIAATRKVSFKPSDVLKETVGSSK